MSTPPKKEVFVVDTSFLFDFSYWLPIPLNKVFWNKLEDTLRSGELILLDVVVGEVIFKKELKAWCQTQQKNGLVKAIDVADKNRAVVINNTYQMIDASTAKSTVDTYIIAYAERNGHTVLSRESNMKPGNLLHKIPDTCAKLGVACKRHPREFLKSIGYKN